MVLLVLEGSNNFMAFGLTSVLVSMKKMRSRKTRSDIVDELKSVLILLCDLIAIGYGFDSVILTHQFLILNSDYFAGS